MAITDGYRTHNEGYEPKYRMPDLLTLEEMRIYFIGTYGCDIKLVEASEEMLERANGVGTLPVPSAVSPRDSDHALLREQLGITELEDRSGNLPEGRARELDSRVMTREDFAKKYGEQPEPAPPAEADEENVDAVGEGNSSTVEGPVTLPAVETEEKRQERESTSKTTGELNDLLGDKPSSKSKK
jgi:hypothetical protein